MAPVRNFKTVPPRDDEREDVDYVFPTRIMVDEATFAEISARIENPRKPNAVLRALFKK